LPEYRKIDKTCILGHLSQKATIWFQGSALEPAELQAQPAVPKARRSLKDRAFPGRAWEREPTAVASASVHFGDTILARPLLFQLGDNSIALDMNKIDRSRLYGSKELEVVDDKGGRCELATLAEDGRTLVGRGSTALGWLDVDLNWCDKSQLKPVDLDGQEVVPVLSSFSAPIRLFDTCSIDDYLQHNIRLVYAAESQDDLADLRAELDRGTIFTFSYSYRGGQEADTGFLLTNDAGEIVIAIGNPTDVNFIGLASTVVESSNDEEIDDGEIMDFDMI